MLSVSATLWNDAEKLWLDTQAGSFNTGNTTRAVGGLQYSNIYCATSFGRFLFLHLDSRFPSPLFFEATARSRGSVGTSSGTSSRTTSPALPASTLYTQLQHET